MTNPDPRIVYADIIDLPHHQSETHPPMSPGNRAAQFASFAALSGYEDMIKEIKKIDLVRRKIVLMKKEGRAGRNVEIDIDRITDIRGELVDYLDEAL